MADACDVTKTIQVNKWAQIGIPCEAPAGQNTIADIFGDDISGIYDTDWVLFSYNPATNAYEKPALTDTVEVGKGYWVISADQQPATLVMPQGSLPVSVQNSTQCLVALGCYETTIVANPGEVQYQMLSSPFDVPVFGENLRINNSLDTEGLTLEESEIDDDIFARYLWSYNHTTNVYDEIQNEIISPWTGFWVAALPTASNTPAPKLLFPLYITKAQLKAIIQNGDDVTQVNTSQITDMRDMFRDATSFNQDISNWDVSNVTTMRDMFRNATSFNQDLSNWNVSNVTTMQGMFSVAKSFNQDISNWDVSNVTTMWRMFSSTKSFNQDISSWDVSNVTNMRALFERATSFNQDISNNQKTF